MRDIRQKVLFLCTGNSCRSQMAEGWARYLHASKMDAYSAGITACGLNPQAVAVMAEAGVDISGQHSKGIEDAGGEFDLVITVCDNAREACPVFPGNAKILHVSFDDPPAIAADAKTEEEILNCYRRVRDEIRTFVEML